MKNSYQPMTRPSPEEDQVSDVETYSALTEGIVMILNVVDVYLKANPHDVTLKFLKRVLLKHQRDLKKLLLKKAGNLPKRKEKTLVTKIVETFSIHLLSSLTVHKLEGIDMKSLWEDSTDETLAGVGFDQMLHLIVKAIGKFMKEL